MLPVDCLKGLDLDGGWTVVEQLFRPSSATGGRFSTGYLVENEKGTKAYLKALDFAEAMQTSDPARELQELTAIYNFERDLLKVCRAKKLKRVVVPLADGAVTVPGNFGPLSRVQYLIFALADSDLRTMSSLGERLETAWSLRSLHHCAVGLRQLHQAGIAHQDLKPSNVLLFGDEGSKIADLGRASSAKLQSPFDDLAIPGDVGYAAPELRYVTNRPRSFEERCLADLYMLGSLVFFHFMGLSMNQALLSKLQGAWEAVSLSDTLEQDMPYIREQFAAVLVDLQAELASRVPNGAIEILLLVRQLCEPDPLLRGDPCRGRRFGFSYDLEKVVSKLDLLATKAELNIR